MILDDCSCAEKLGSAGRFLSWLDEKDCDAANASRDTLLISLSDRTNYTFFNTKPHVGELSPGCLHCGNGTWSCLFVNQVCNASCFYCPMEPATRYNPPPTALGVDFPESERYVKFLEKAGYGGIGLSGGEPLMDLDRTIEIVKTVRSKTGEKIYIWLYTNGILATRERLKRLYEAGINEIRFDISAINYSLKPVKLAREWSWRVTVEIPAIPEDEEKMGAVLPVLKEIGVDHLHLHQLTVNKWNAHHFVEHDYTLLHEPENAVVESEMTALRLLQKADEEKIGLNVQYCARAYKIRFQGRGRRLRLLQLGWRDKLPGEVDIDGYVISDDPVHPEDLEGEIFEELPFIKSPQAGCLVGKRNHILPEKAVKRLEPLLVRKLGLPDEQPVPLQGWEQYAIRLIPVTPQSSYLETQGLPLLK